MKKNISISSTILSIKFLITLIFLIYYPFILYANYYLCNSTIHELSPPYTFFGTSNWSLFVTGFYLSAFYIWANVPRYCFKMIDTEEIKWKKRSFTRYFFSITRGILTIILIFGCLFAFLAGTDIWHGNENDFSSEWTIMFIYYKCFYIYLLINIIDIILKKTSFISPINHK